MAGFVATKKGWLGCTLLLLPEFCVCLTCGCSAGKWRHRLARLNLARLALSGEAGRGCFKPFVISMAFVINKPC